MDLRRVLQQSHIVILLGQKFTAWIATFMLGVLVRLLKHSESSSFFGIILSYDEKNNDAFK